MQPVVRQLLALVTTLVVALTLCEFCGQRLEKSSVGGVARTFRPSVVFQATSYTLRSFFRWVGFLWVRVFDLCHLVATVWDLLVRALLFLIDLLEWFLPLRELAGAFSSVFRPARDILISPLHVFAGWFDAVEVSANQGLNLIFFGVGTTRLWLWARNNFLSK